MSVVTANGETPTRRRLELRVRKGLPVERERELARREALASGAYSPVLVAVEPRICLRVCTIEVHPTTRTGAVADDLRSKTARLSGR
mgnify:CR=1 FL=1